MFAAPVVVESRAESHSRRRWRFEGYALIALQRKRSYQFHLRWGATYFPDISNIYWISTVRDSNPADFALFSRQIDQQHCPMTVTEALGVEFSLLDLATSVATTRSREVMPIPRGTPSMVRQCGRACRLRAKRATAPPRRGVTPSYIPAT